MVTILMKCKIEKKKNKSNPCHQLFNAIFSQNAWYAATNNGLAIELQFKHFLFDTHQI